jgi:hypothetical protein
MMILALDLAGTTGYAVGEPGKRPAHALISAPKTYDLHQGLRYFGKAMRNLVLYNGVERIVVEAPFCFNVKTYRTLVAHHTVMRYVAAEIGLGAHQVTEINSQVWRKECGIPTQAPLHVRDSRAWLKGKAHEHCARHGLRPKSDDEAEALCIWLYAVARFPHDRVNERLPLFEITPAA